MTADERWSPRVVAVIQARMGSTRLPGKVVRRLGKRTVLEWVIRAARAAEGVDAVVVATSTNAVDDTVASVAHDAGVDVVRGSEEDVLARFVVAGRDTDADAIVRLTADCPLLDPRLIAQVVAVWLVDPGLDYVSTTLDRRLPRGLDVELVTVSALERLDRSAVGWDRAHVTSALYAASSTVPRAGLTVSPPGNRFRVTLDEEDDARALDAIVGELGDAPPSWREVVALLESRPDIVGLNAHVEQKAIEAG